MWENFLKMFRHSWCQYIPSIPDSKKYSLIEFRLWVKPQATTYHHHRWWFISFHHLFCTKWNDLEFFRINNLLIMLSYLPQREKFCFEDNYSHILLSSPQFLAFVCQKKSEENHIVISIWILYSYVKYNYLYLSKCPVHE